MAGIIGCQTWKNGKDIMEMSYHLLDKIGLLLGFIVEEREYTGLTLETHQRIQIHYFDGDSLVISGGRRYHPYI